MNYNVVNAAGLRDKNANKIFPMSVKQISKFFLEDKPYFFAFIEVCPMIRIL